MARVDKMKSIVRKTHVVTPKLSHAKQQYRMDWNSWKEIKVFSFCVLYYSCGGTGVPNVPEAEQCSAHRRWEEKVGNNNRKNHISHSKPKLS